VSVCRVDKNLDRYPPELRKHINERMTDRTFLPPMRVELQNWLDTLPIAPDLDEAPQGMGWKQKFESFTIYGEGKLVKTLGTIYNPITDRPAAVDLREWVMKQKAGRYEHIMVANEYLDGLRKQGYNKAYVYHTSGDSVYIALFSDPNNKNRPGVVKLNGKPVQVLVRFSNDTSGIKEKECLQEWKGETASALVERTMKWFKTLKNASQKKVSMADILGSMEEDNFDGVNSHPSDLGLSKKPEIRGDEDNDPCFLSLPNRRKSKKASTQPSTYVSTVKAQFPKAFVKPFFNPSSPNTRRVHTYVLMDGVPTSTDLDEDGRPICTQISDECDSAIAAWESAASRLTPVESGQKAPEVNEVVFTNLAVARTVVNTYQHLGMTKEMLPKKGMAVWLVPPIASGYIPVKVSWTDTKSTYGERLYRCEHCKPISEKHLEG